MLYIHVPFCASRCVYCGFYSTTLLDLRDAYVDAVCHEIDMRLHSAPTSVYIGGGTPSMLSSSQLARIFAHIDTAETVEVTLECNPDDISNLLRSNEPSWSGLASLPINRISLGVQTFDDERLKFLNRRHTAQQAVDVVRHIVGHTDLKTSIDLIYGFPGQTLGDWQRDVDTAVSLGVGHISAYCLTYEPGTSLFRMREEGRVVEADEETCRRMYYLLKDCLEAAGYEHYEISNFARPGCRAVHNSGYWSGIPYVGIGAAAHSYDGSRRSWNVSDVKAYIDAVGAGELPAEGEDLDAAAKYNDRVMLTLRTCDGLDLGTLTPEQRSYCLANARRHIANGMMVMEGSCKPSAMRARSLIAEAPLKFDDSQGNSLRLTRDALFISDYVVSDLML